VRLLLLVPLLAACQKSAPAPAATPSSSAATSVAMPAPAAPARAWFEGSWQGTFLAERFKVEVPAGGVKEWKDDDGKRASGENVLKLSIAADGSVTGRSQGPLGELLVNGRAENDRVALSLASADTEGFHGSILATQTPEGMGGRVSASSWDSLVVRHGAVTLARATP
jgi:hypothetical protein